MAVNDIVPAAGEYLEDTLAAASPDLLRTMIREFAQRMMDAEAEQLYGAGAPNCRSTPGSPPDTATPPRSTRPLHDPAYALHALDAMAHAARAIDARGPTRADRPLGEVVNDEVGDALVCPRIAVIMLFPSLTSAFTGYETENGFYAMAVSTRS